MADVSKINGYNIKDATARAALDNKQNTISDLSTIRAGAALGATAVQPESGKGLFSGSYNDLSNKPSTFPPSEHNHDGRYLREHQDISGKADITYVDGEIERVEDEIPSIEGLATETYVDNHHDSTKQDVISDLATIRSGAALGATSVQPESGKGLFSGNYNDLSNKPTIPSAVTESTVSGWGFTKNTGTYSKPSSGIPASDIAANAVTTDKINANAVTLGKLSTEVQESLAKADTALQSVPSTYRTAAEQDIIDDTKSSVSVSATGTATDVVKYIIIDGVEKKLPSSEISPEVLENFITAEDEDPSSPASKDADTLGGHVPSYYAQKEYVDTQLAQKYVKPSGGIPTADIAASAVTRAKLATDALYSPLKAINASTYDVVVDDIGKTVEFTYNGNISVNISNEIASALPKGAEIAFLHGYNKAISISIGSNWYLAKPGELGAKGRTLTCSDGYQLVAVKRIGNNWFTATGNFD